MNLYEKIKVLAKERGLSICKVEREAGIANAIIRRWGEGTGPSITSVKKVADVLGVSLDELVQE